MKKKILTAVILLSVFVAGCSVYETIVNLSRLKFKLGNVNGLSISGVSISNKSKLKDFTAMEILKISTAFAQGSLPVSFVLNVQALNPNDGTGGYPRTNATLKSFPWRLMINDKETISGNIGSPVTVPGTGEDVIIPISISLDLVNFFKQKGYQDLINLALNIGGDNSSPTNLALYAQPTVTSALGDITYPQEIKIVSYEFSN